MTTDSQPEKPRKFSIGAFLVAYAIFSFLLLAFGMPITDVGGAGLILIGVVFPIPFFFAGYYAHKATMSILYAFFVATIGIGFSLFLLPYLAGLFHR